MTDQVKALNKKVDGLLEEVGHIKREFQLMRARRLERRLKDLEKNAGQLPR